MEEKRTDIQRIIGLITPDTLEDSSEAVLIDKDASDILEWRVDLFGSPQDAQIMEQILSLRAGRPLILTVRLERDGGLWPNTKSQERLDLIKDLAPRVQADWVDWELEEVDSLPDLKTWAEAQGISLLCSHHNFNAAYSRIELQAIAQKMKQTGVQKGKISQTFQENSQEIELYRFLSSDNEDSFIQAAFSMGALGRRSRIVSSLLGAPWTYGFWGSQASAPGQWRTSDMKSLFNSEVLCEISSNADIDEILRKLDSFF